MQTADLQTGILYVASPLPSQIANLTNLTKVLVWLTGVLVWLTEVASLQSAFVAQRFKSHLELGIFSEPQCYFYVV